MVEQGRSDGSGSKVYHQANGNSRSGKKNVKFLSPKRGEKFSSSSYQESSVSKSAGAHRGKQMLEVEDDMIGESIKIEESYQASNLSGSRSKKSGQTASMR
jgi:hypothetical protein